MQTSEEMSGNFEDVPLLEGTSGGLSVLGLLTSGPILALEEHGVLELLAF